MTTTVTPLRSFRTTTPYPFCPGCGHGPILDTINEAMVRLELDPRQVVLVTDIGCSGLSDQYFTTNAFHGLHGRAVTYATGIKLANPDLTVIVIMGDGGTGIGGTHLISAARRNVGVTVLVMNNLNFGMTGGQHSATTPEGAVTATTPQGNLEHPMDVCATVGVNGAGYVWRGSGFDEDLVDRIAAAIAHPGFALLDIWELCTAYYVRKNKLSRRGIHDTMEQLGMAAGLLYERDAPEYSAAYRAAHADLRGASQTGHVTIPVEFGHSLDGPRAVVVAGSAGAKVRSAAMILGEAAIRSGLWVTQKDDYPVTVKTGHSVSEIVMSPHPRPLVPVARPDGLVVLSTDGVAQVRAVAATLDPDALVVVVPDVMPLVTPGRLVVIDPATSGVPIGKTARSLAVVTAFARLLGAFPDEALRSAAGHGPFAAANAAAIEAGLALVD